MVHGGMVHGGMVHHLRLAMVHLRMIHAGVAFVSWGGLRSGRTGSFRHRMAHGAMAYGFLFAFGLGRRLRNRHRVPGMVLCDSGGGGAREEHGDDQAHQSSPTRFTSGAEGGFATVTI